ncbi:protein-tyrosine phosphatase family protein [Microbacterium sp. A93]|uniref:protein-tyrosine phosphatase family protein n=1 Tax=Microbacterium sp. A93 TaxID=3450716 RepID=UPI003F425B07
MLHGWPGLRARHLIGLGVALAGRSRVEGRWPAIERMDYSQWDGAEGAAVVEHPDDPGVLLGPAGALGAVEYGAVVSLCRVGSAEARVSSADDHAEFWLIDGENPYPEFTLRDAAETVRRFREEGKRVLLHCVRMESRTPTVAAFYGALVTGSTLLEALERVRTVLPKAAPSAAFRRLLENGLTRRTAGLTERASTLRTTALILIPYPATGLRLTAFVGCHRLFSSSSPPLFLTRFFG